MVGFLLQGVGVGRPKSISPRHQQQKYRRSRRAFGESAEASDDYESSLLKRANLSVSISPRKDQEHASPRRTRDYGSPRRDREHDSRMSALMENSPLSPNDGHISNLRKTVKRQQDEIRRWCPSRLFCI
jgi:hypothetical protein